MTTVRMSDVASRAGVSMKTVSNVLNGYPHITARTRAKVEAAIAELDYKPNVSARSLRKGRVGVIALAVPQLAAPYFAELAAAVSRAAKRQGVAVLIEQTDGDPAAEKLVLDGLRDRLIDGILFSPAGPGHRPTAPARPIVLLGEHQYAGLDNVAVDSARAAYDATAHLLGLGRRRIAVIGDAAEAAQRTGYRKALQAAGLIAEPALELRRPGSHFGGTDRQHGAGAMRRLLKLPEPPDAVVCGNDLLALGALRVLGEAGLSVPGDVAVMGFGDLGDGRHHSPALSTVSPDREQLAELALTLLLDRIAGTGPPGPRQLTVPHTLKLRDSTHSLAVTPARA